MIAHSISNATFVICGDCGSSVYAGDPESVIKMDELHIWLRCRNSCCEHAGRYSAVDLINRSHVTIDHTTNLLLGG